MVYFGHFVCINYYLVITFSSLLTEATGDYVGASGNLVFSDTSGNQVCFSVSTLTDGINEVTECFNVQISSNQQDGLILSPATASVCILDNDRKIMQLLIPTAN